MDSQNMTLNDRVELRQLREKMLRDAGFHGSSPRGKTFCLFGTWKPEDGDEQSTYLEGTVTGFSIDKTERTNFEPQLTLTVDQPSIFDCDLQFLTPKDPKNGIWTAQFIDGDYDAHRIRVDVFVIFDAPI